jgi:thiosulfate dehydrogenase [quinone] large subunit
MTTTTAHKAPSRFARTRPHGTGETTVSRASTAAPYVWALARLSLGWVFLWAFLDKFFGLGHDTAGSKAWIHGGHPTLGFLKLGTAGPFKGFYQGIAGTAWVDWLFMISLAGLGVALILGIGMRVAAVAGSVLLVMMWSAVLPPDSNVFMDDHLIYALLLVGLALISAGDTLGLGRWWSSTALVRRFPVLK